MTKISTVIITLNEEKNITRCIKSVLPVSDEIIIVDSYSTDRTAEVAKSLGAKVIYQQFLGHVEQKNFALSKAAHDYVLSLDGDEALSEQLLGKIKGLKEKGLEEFDSYSFHRCTHYVNKWIYHCGWYPDEKLRLFNRHKGKWSGLNPHDIVQMQPDCTQQKIEGDLLHYSYDSITDHVNQTNYFTTIAAKAAYKQGIKSNNFKIVTRPFLKFIKDYFLKGGILDGRYGFVICYINSLSALLKYSKLKDLQDGNPIDHK